MPYLAYVTASGKIIGAYQKVEDAQTISDADAEVSHDTTDRELPDTFNPIDGEWFLNTTDDKIELAGISDSDLIIERRQTILSNLRKLEEVQGLAVWAHWNDDNARAQVYSRWIEMQVRAVYVDSNLSSNTKYEWMLAESLIPGNLWYVLFKMGSESSGNDLAWRAWLDDDRSMWTYYQTTGTTTTPNSRAGIARGTITLEIPDDSEDEDSFDWVSYMHGLSQPA